MAYRITISALLLICFQIGWGENPKCKLIDTFRECLAEKPYISFGFTQTIKSDIFETVDTIQGQLMAGEKGRFRLESPEQVVVSDGVQYWSYSVANEQVLVDSVAKMGDWDPLTILYNPESVFRCESEKRSEENIVFNMRAVDDRTEPGSFKLRVSNQKLIPLGIEYDDINGSFIKTYINNFKNHSKLPDSLFILQIPPGVEVIEMP